MSWNVDAPEFVPGRRFTPTTHPTEPPQPPKEVSLTSRSRDPCHVSRVTNGEPSSSSSSSGMVSSARYSDVTALHTEGGEVADVQSEVAEGLFLESGYTSSSSYLYN